jgi:hypothetical protein
MTLPLYHAHGVASEEFIKLAGPASEGVRLPAAALLIANKLAANDPQKPSLKATQGLQRQMEDRCVHLWRPRL